MVHNYCECGWSPKPNVRSTGRAVGAHAMVCTVRRQGIEDRESAKRMRSEMDLQDDDGGLSDHPQKSPRLSQVCFQ